MSAILPCTCSNSTILGTDCNLICPQCNNGICELSSSGDAVECNCPQGYDPSINCTNCLPTLYGSDCSKQCIGCNNHGTCFFGINGNGLCTCFPNYDPSDNCATVIGGGLPSWVVPASIGGAAGLIIIIALILCAMQITTQKRVKAIHEEMIIGENMHNSTEFENQKENSSLSQTKKLSSDDGTQSL